MDRNGFAAAATGTLVPNIGGRKAFVPAPLPPPRIDVGAFLPEFTRATQAVGELKSVGRSIANPLLLVRPLQRREAVSSSSMEGTYTTLSGLFLFEAGAAESATRGDNREVLNYVRALEGAIEGLDALPISSRLIRDAHRTLLTGWRGIAGLRWRRAEEPKVPARRSIVGMAPEGSSSATRTGSAARGGSKARASSPRRRPRRRALSTL